MIELLQTYSLTDIVTITIGLVLAAKGLVDFIDWLKNKLNIKFGNPIIKENEENKRKEEINNYISEQEEFRKKVSESINKIQSFLDLLIESDKDDIKSYITEKHHYFCYEKKWIDDYSMDCIEKRYKHYVDEKGNSFVADLMKELRELPRRPL